MTVDTDLPWRVQDLPPVLIRLATPRILHGPKHFFSRSNGTNDHEQPLCVRLVPMLYREG